MNDMKIHSFTAQVSLRVIMITVTRIFTIVKIILLYLLCKRPRANNSIIEWHLSNNLNVVRHVSHLS